MKRLAYLSVLPILGVIFMAFSVEKVVKYQKVEENSKYFKIVRENNDLEEFGNVNVTAYNKVLPTLYLYKNKIALTSGSNEISEAMIADASKYFKNYGYTLSVLGKQLDAKKNLEKIEISLIDDKKVSKKRVKIINEDYPENNEKFNFDLIKMRAKSARSIGGAITIIAIRGSGIHFVAPLSPPPPPPIPPAPTKGKTKLSINTTERKIDVITLIFQSEYVKIPANMTEIKNKIYVENEPTKNSYYKDFLDFINQDAYFSKKYAKNMIPENWGNVKNMKNPVIYVSYEQALEFCKWKSEMLTYQIMNQKTADYTTILKENDKRSKKLKFRLPTEAEWYIMVKKGLDKSKNSNGSGFTCVLDLT